MLLKGSRLDQTDKRSSFLGYLWFLCGPSTQLEYIFLITFRMLLGLEIGSIRIRIVLLGFVIEAIISQELEANSYMHELAVKFIVLLTLQYCITVILPESLVGSE